MNVFTKITSLFFILINVVAFAQEKSLIDIKESAYYKIVDVPIPNDVMLEVGGLAMTDDDKLGVSTRRGDVWLIDKPYSKTPIFGKFATGLHEPLGLAFRDNSFYLTQRGELTRLQDRNNDGKVDSFKTIYSWPLSGNYHEYSYGPKFKKNGDMIVTLNLGWSGGGVSLTKWRGWMLQITPEGDMTPIATGLRSPAGFAINDQDDLFYTENQGDWVGSGRLTHLESGDFAGHVEGLKWTDDPQSPLKLKVEDIEEFSGLTLYEYAKKIPELKAPAIWFPHTVLGISTSDMLYHKKGVDFGPFENQIFVGDQGHSKIMRVYMEKVNGVYQGASFPFKEGFSSGILRMIWGNDSSMFVGMTSRGWASTGKKAFGLQRLEWTGKTPFEIKTMKAQDDGFLLEFTKPVNKKTASDMASYNMISFTYKYHVTYGSPIEQKQDAMVHAAIVSEDGKSVKLLVHGMRLGFIHQLRADGVKAANGESLLHSSAYYTLNEVPGGVLKSPQMPKMPKENESVKQPKHTSEMPFTWDNGSDKKLTISTKPGMKFDIEELTIKRNTKLELTFVNVDDMLHNLVFAMPGKDVPNTLGLKALELGLDAPKYNYVPDSSLVLYHTATVGPESSETIYFEIPRRKGQYWIVCTFPGHSNTMKIKVKVI
ncbi:plastocyanin/azurin family copper-binding protein [Mariniflexile sp. AS56]|uniref:plastocyanin/azurin family copper-binding protein n=1 Tax=Mariniflexile sp. AS56 TaxID=3063957 RepID=UPI0026EAA0AC|nr:plastocyanin/azurin family copper-binding protein [Mariniflexile sp. AS56]MDO7172400.1 plastocyanin/azurin family copper-binding protein [Mariniflexile sp. AS56]